MSEVIGYAGGTFDLFHTGHVHFLRLCKRQCDKLAVGLNTDEFATRYKRKPIMNLIERITLVSACKYVDNTFVNYGDEDSRPAILTSQASKVFHGDDWDIEALLKQMGFGKDFMHMHGIEVVHIPYTPDISTTDLIERCRASQ